MKRELKILAALFGIFLVAYFLPLSRIGILKSCTGRTSERCENCELLRFCDEIKV